MTKDVIIDSKSLAHVVVAGAIQAHPKAPKKTCSAHLRLKNQNNNNSQA